MIERSPEKDIYQKLNAVSIFLIIYRLDGTTKRM